MVCPTILIFSTPWIKSSLPVVVPRLVLKRNLSSTNRLSAASSRPTSAATYSSSAARTRISSVCWVAAVVMSCAQAWSGAIAAMTASVTRVETSNLRCQRPGSGAAEQREAVPSNRLLESGLVNVDLRERRLRRQPLANVDCLSHEICTARDPDRPTNRSHLAACCSHRRRFCPPTWESSRGPPPQETCLLRSSRRQPGRQ